MNSRLTHSDRKSAEALVGTCRRFGPTGPVYEVLGISEQPREREIQMRVRVLRTEETIDYNLSDLLQDPQEA